ncbi:MAG: cell division protein FtsZ [Bacteroidales bacterium]|nr:cell division protein FtsZ [Bacteroidales bacterium]
MPDFENFTFVETEENAAPIIKVIGVGGGGSNAVNNMWNKGIKDVEFAICNTDQQALKSSPIPEKISIGTRGAGGNPKVAAAKARENSEVIIQSCTGNTRMVFLAACMGGGTGTGASPVIAETIKQIEINDEETNDILIVAIVTMPFSWEGKKRIENAKAGIAELKKYADSVIVINNDKLRSFGNKTMPELFRLADEILLTATRSIAEIITNNLYVNIDFQDVYSIMSGSKTALMGCGVGEGEHRAEQAINAAANSVLLDDQNIHNAKGCLLSITYSSDHAVTMDEFELINSYVSNEIIDNEDPDSNVIWGTGIDDSLGEKLQVTLIATGFNRDDQGTMTTIATPEARKIEKEEVAPKETIVLETEPIQTEPAIVEAEAPAAAAETEEEPELELKVVTVNPTETKTVIENPVEKKIIIDIDDNDISMKDEEEETVSFHPQEQMEEDDIKVVTPAPHVAFDAETTKVPTDIHHQPNQPVSHHENMGTNITIENLGIRNSEPKSDVSTPKAGETRGLTEDDFQQRMARMKSLKDILMQGTDGIEKIANMDLVHGNAYQSLHSSVSEVSNSNISTDGSLGINASVFGNPD